LKEGYEKGDTSLKEGYEKGDASLKEGYEKADTSLKEGYKADDTLIRDGFKEADTRITTNYKADDDEIKALMNKAEAELKADDMKLENSLKGQMNVNNELLEAKYLSGDIQTKLDIERLMRAENKGLRDQLLAGDETMMGKMKSGNADLESRFNNLLKEQHDEFSDDLSSEVQSLEDDFESVEKDLEAKDAELAEDLEVGLKDLNAKNEGLEEDIEDLEDVFSNELEALEDKFDDKMNDFEAASDLNDIKALALSGQPDHIEQHVNIDLDFGTSHLKDDSATDVLLNLDWWQYAFIGLGFAVVMIVKCLFMDRGQSVEDPLLPRY
jgi:hypothetical protein